MEQFFCTDGSSCGFALGAIQVLIALFMAVLFLQSGLDKILDRKGNMSWLNGHFAASPLRHTVGLNLTIITILEVAAGAFSLVGACQILIFNETALASVGLLLSAISILCLFIGQRLAKDYVGAAVLVNYFILCIIGLFVLR